MKRILLSSIVLVIGLSGIIGQETSSITMNKVFGGYQFFQNSKRLTMSQLVQTMQSNEQAYMEIKSAQSTYVLATVIGGAGGFMVGWPLGTAIAGGEPEWAMAGVGVGLILVSIPITQKFNKQAKLAVDTYNSGLATGSKSRKSELKFTFTANRVGLRLTF